MYVITFFGRARSYYISRSQDLLYYIFAQCIVVRFIFFFFFNFYLGTDSILHFVMSMIISFHTWGPIIYLIDRRFTSRHKQCFFIYLGL